VLVCSPHTPALQMVKIIASEGGDIFKFAGDAMIVLWPDWTGTMAERARHAVQCAESVQKALHAATLEEGVTLSVKIGIGVGNVTILHLGGVLGRMEYVAVGEPLVQAFGAEEHAQAGGEVLVSPAVWALISEHVRPLEVLSDGFVRITEKGRGHPEGSIVTKVPRKGKGGAGIELTLAGSEAELRLKRYTPGAIQLWISPDAPDLESWGGDLRNVTVLFVNLGLRTDDLLAAAKYREPMVRAHRTLVAVQESVYAYEGSVNKFLMDDKGSTLIAVFGLPPLSHHDDPTRGVLAALAICDRLWDLELQASVGVTSGVVFCGVVGSTTRKEYSVLGDTVNLSARLMQKAMKDGGGVIVDSEIVKATGPEIEYANLGEIKVKGKSNLIRVSRPYPQSSVDEGLPLRGRPPNYPGTEPRLFHKAYKRQRDRVLSYRRLRPASLAVPAPDEAVTQPGEGSAGGSSPTAAATTAAAAASSSGPPTPPPTRRGTPNRPKQSRASMAASAAFGTSLLSDSGSPTSTDASSWWLGAELPAGTAQFKFSSLTQPEPTATPEALAISLLWDRPADKSDTLPAITELDLSLSPTFSSSPYEAGDPPPGRAAGPGETQLTAAAGAARALAKASTGLVPRPHYASNTKLSSGSVALDPEETPSFAALRDFCVRLAHKDGLLPSAAGNPANAGAAAGTTCTTDTALVSVHQHSLAFAASLTDPSTADAEWGALLPQAAGTSFHPRTAEYALEIGTSEKAIVIPCHGIKGRALPLSMLPWLVSESQCIPTSAMASGSLPARIIQARDVESRFSSHERARVALLTGKLVLFSTSQGGCLVLEGDAGSGKTAVLARAVGEDLVRKTSVVSVCADPYRRMDALSVFEDIARILLHERIKQSRLIASKAADSSVAEGRLAIKAPEEAAEDDRIRTSEMSRACRQALTMGGVSKERIEQVGGVLNKVLNVRLHASSESTVLVEDASLRPQLNALRAELLMAIIAGHCGSKDEPDDDAASLRPQPLMLCIDDAQYLHPAAWDVLARLAARATLLAGTFGSLPLLLVVSTRPLCRYTDLIFRSVPPGYNDLLGNGLVERIYLGRMAPRDLKALTALALEWGGPITQNVFDLVEQRSGGRPGTVIELLRLLVAKGRIMVLPENSPIAVGAESPGIQAGYSPIVACLSEALPRWKRRSRALTLQAPPAVLRAPYLRRSVDALGAQTDRLHPLAQLVLKTAAVVSHAARSQLRMRVAESGSAAVDDAAKDAAVIMSQDGDRPPPGTYARLSIRDARTVSLASVAGIDPAGKPGPPGRRNSLSAAVTDVFTASFDFGVLCDAFPFPAPRDALLAECRRLVSLGFLVESPTAAVISRAKALGTALAVAGDEPATSRASAEPAKGAATTVIFHFANPVVADTLRLRLLNEQSAKVLKRMQAAAERRARALAGRTLLAMLEAAPRAASLVWVRKAVSARTGKVSMSSMRGEWKERLMCVSKDSIEFGKPPSAKDMGALSGALDPIPWAHEPDDVTQTIPLSVSEAAVPAADEVRTERPFLVRIRATRWVKKGVEFTETKLFYIAVNGPAEQEQLVFMVNFLADMARKPASKGGKGRGSAKHHGGVDEGGAVEVIGGDSVGGVAARFGMSTGLEGTSPTTPVSYISGESLERAGAIDGGRSFTGDAVQICIESARGVHTAKHDASLGASHAPLHESLRGPVVEAWVVRPAPKSAVASALNPHSELLPGEALPSFVVPDSDEATMSEWSIHLPESDPSWASEDEGDVSHRSSSRSLGGATTPSSSDADLPKSLIISSLPIMGKRPGGATLIGRSINGVRTHPITSGHEAELVWAASLSPPKRVKALGARTMFALPLTASEAAAGLLLLTIREESLSGEEAVVGYAMLPLASLTPDLCDGDDDEGTDSIKKVDTGKLRRLASRAVGVDITLPLVPPAELQRTLFANAAVCAVISRFADASPTMTPELRESLFGHPLSISPAFSSPESPRCGSIRVRLRLALSSATATSLGALRVSVGKAVRSCMALSVARPLKASAEALSRLVRSADSTMSEQVLKRTAKAMSASLSTKSVSEIVRCGAWVSPRRVFVPLQAIAKDVNALLEAASIKMDDPSHLLVPVSCETASIWINPVAGDVGVMWHPRDIVATVIAWALAGASSKLKSKALQRSQTLGALGIDTSSGVRPPLLPPSTPVVVVDGGALPEQRNASGSPSVSSRGRASSTVDELSAVVNSRASAALEALEQVLGKLGISEAATGRSALQHLLEPEVVEEASGQTPPVTLQGDDLAAIRKALQAAAQALAHSSAATTTIAAVARDASVASESEGTRSAMKPRRRTTGAVNGRTKKAFPSSDDGSLHWNSSSKAAPDSRNPRGSIRPGDSFSDLRSALASTSSDDVEKQFVADSFVRPLIPRGISPDPSPLPEDQLLRPQAFTANKLAQSFASKARRHSTPAGVGGKAWTPLLTGPKVLGAGGAKLHSPLNPRGLAPLLEEGPSGLPKVGDDSKVEMSSPRESGTTPPSVDSPPRDVDVPLVLVDWHGSTNDQRCALQTGYMAFGQPSGTAAASSGQSGWSLAGTMDIHHHRRLVSSPSRWRLQALRKPLLQSPALPAGTATPTAEDAAELEEDPFDLCYVQVEGEEQLQGPYAASNILDWYEADEPDRLVLLGPGAGEWRPVREVANVLRLRHLLSISRRDMGDLSAFAVESSMSAKRDAMLGITVVSDPWSWQFDMFRGGQVRSPLTAQALATFLFTSSRIGRFLPIQPDAAVAFIGRIVDSMASGHDDASLGALERMPRYHTLYHVVDVLQAVIVVLTKWNGLSLVTPEDAAALLVAALGHDLEHPGVSNAHLVATEDSLALRYADESPLEHHHAARCAEVARDTALWDGAFEGSLPEERVARKARLRWTTTQLILATDMRRHADLMNEMELVGTRLLEALDAQRSGIVPGSAVLLNSSNAAAISHAQAVLDGTFSRNTVALAAAPPVQGLTAGESFSTQVVHLPGALVWETSPDSEDEEDDVASHTAASETDPFRRAVLSCTRGGGSILLPTQARLTLCNVFLHASDISNPTRPWPLSKLWTERLLQEMARQGDIEASAGLAISPGCNRDTVVPASFTLGFADFIVAPLYAGLAAILPLSVEAFEGLVVSRNAWSTQLPADSPLAPRQEAINRVLLPLVREAAADAQACDRTSEARRRAWRALAEMSEGTTKVESGESVDEDDDGEQLQVDVTVETIEGVPPIEWPSVTATLPHHASSDTEAWDDDDDDDDARAAGPNDTWDAFRDDEGDVYYCNRITGESQWDKPEGFTKEPVDA
jgi:class 3 adenylate cyclase